MTSIDEIAAKPLHSMEACLQCDDLKSRGQIVVREQSAPRRRRYSVGHELGHFLVAKWCGVKCEKFYVGFDVPIKILGLQLPSKLFHFQWGETEYGVGIIPLGGYVKMLGQDDDPRAAQAALGRTPRRYPRVSPAASNAGGVSPRNFARVVWGGVSTTVSISSSVVPRAASPLRASRSKTPRPRLMSW